MPLVFTLTPSDSLDKPLHNKSSILVAICMLQILLVWAQFFSHAFQTPARMQILVKGVSPPCAACGGAQLCRGCSEDQCDHAPGSVSSGRYLKSGRLQPGPRASDLQSSDDP